jgi:cytoskeletal protein CcmA (bactofilin family)
MKNKLFILITLLIVSVQASRSVPVGSDLELIPAPRNLGININQASQKLTVNGAIALTNLGFNPVVLNNQPSLFVKDNGLFYKSSLHTNPFRIDLNDISNGNFLNAVLTNPTFKGNINFDSNVKIKPFTVNGAITASMFNGGILKGDGSLLTGIVPSSLKAPDGSPDPALRVDNFGQIGIGTITPSQKLEVAGNIKANNFIGNGAGLTNIPSNVINNLSIDSLIDGKSDSSSVFLGSGSGIANTGNTFSTAIGIDALKNNANSAVNNSAVGYQALMNNQGSNNTALGRLSLQANTSGWQNTGLGSATLLSNITGNNNTATGVGALKSNLSGNFNTAMGSSALELNETGSANTAIGYSSMIQNPKGQSNVAIGAESLFNIVQGDANTAIGYKSGSNLVRGSRNITIGSNINVTNPEGSDQLNIGNLVTGNLPRNVNGNLLDGSVKINGITDISGRLEVVGNVKANSFIGDGAGLTNIPSNVINNLSIDSLIDGKSDSSSVFLGSGSGTANAGNTFSTAIGIDALKNTNVNSFNNTAVGYQSLMTNTNGYDNTALGKDSLKKNLTGSQNTSVGSKALELNTIGNNNTAVGVASLSKNTDGILNTAIGVGSLEQNLTGKENTAIGVRSIIQNPNGQGNVAVGTDTLLSTVQGDANTAIGYKSGSNLVRGSRNITIGSNINVTNPNGNDQLNIGNLVTGNLPRNVNGNLLDGSLKITGSSLLDGNVNINGLLDIDGTLNVRGKILSPSNPWILVHSENFQSTTAGWSNNTTSDCGGKKILGGFNITSTTPLTKTFDLTQYAHTHVMVKFNYYSLDSWDNDYGILKTDGLTTWSSKKIFYTDEDRTIIPNCGSGGNSTNTTLGKDLVLTGESSIDHSSNSLNLSFESTLNEAPTNESYGIDNLEIWIKTPGLEAQINPPNQGNSCGPNGYYTVQGSDISNQGNYADARGTGPATADFSKCLNLLFVETGHSVTRTWNFINPANSSNVVFKIERRRTNTSAGVGFTYWFPTNVSGIPNPLNVTFPNADILINCSYLKDNNTYTCSHSVSQL